MLELKNSVLHETKRDRLASAEPYYDVFPSLVVSFLFSYSLIFSFDRKQY